LDATRPCQGFFLKKGLAQGACPPNIYNHTAPEKTPPGIGISVCVRCMHDTSPLCTGENAASCARGPGVGAWSSPRSKFCSPRLPRSEPFHPRAWRSKQLRAVGFQQAGVVVCVCFGALLSEGNVSSAPSYLPLLLHHAHLYLSHWILSGHIANCQLPPTCMVPPEELPWLSHLRLCHLSASVLSIFYVAGSFVASPPGGAAPNAHDAVAVRVKQVEHPARFFQRQPAAAPAAASTATRADAPDPAPTITVNLGATRGTHRGTSRGTSCDTRC